MKMLALVGAFLCLVPAGSARASEVTSYTYDELGRLVISSIQQGLNAGISSTATFDAAGNRTNYAVGSGCTLTAADNGSTDEFSVYAWVYASGSCSTPITLSYSTQNGTAISGTHYHSKSGTIVLTNLSSGVGINISPIPGSVQWPDLKVFYVNFAVQSGSASFADSQSALTLSSSN